MPLEGPFQLLLVFAIFLSLAAPVYSFGCARGWVSYKDDCYLFSDTKSKKNFDDSAAICQSMNASLVSFKTDAEVTWAMNQVKSLASRGSPYFWVGLRRVVNGNTATNTFQWQANKDGDKSYPNYTRATNQPRLTWYRGRPYPVNSYYAKRYTCVRYYRYTWRTYVMLDYPCTYALQYICKRNNRFADLCDISNGWQHLGNSCYRYNLEPETWADAEDICESYGGSLVTFKTRTELGYVKDSVLNTADTGQSIWIGIKDTNPGATAVKDKFRWVGNTTVAVDNWGIGEPKTDYDNNCGAILTKSNNDHRWKATNCEDEYKYICQRDQGTCPPGWLSYHDKCYLRVLGATQKKTWPEAQFYCSSQGGDLAVIQSQEEADYLKDIFLDMNTASIDYSWIGYSTDANSKNVKASLQGKDVTIMFTNWDPNTSRNVTNINRKDCAAVRTGSRSKSWVQRYCYEKNNFVCQMDIHLFEYNQTAKQEEVRKCQPAFVSRYGMCYHFNTDPDKKKKLGEAAAFCKSINNGHPAWPVVINSTLTQAVVSNNITVDSVISVKEITENTNTYQNEIPTNAGVNFKASIADTQNWNDSQPARVASDTDRQCVIAQAATDSGTGMKGLWKVVQCDQRYNVICQAIGEVMPVGPGPPPSTQCGGNWKYSSIVNKCYQFFYGELSWDMARRECQKISGDLASITSKEQLVAISHVIEKQVGELNIWIGASQRKMGSSLDGWSWSDGSPFVLANWAAGFPVRYQDCVEISAAYVGLKWKTSSCDKRYSYVCQKNPDGGDTGPTTVPPTPAPETPCNQPMISGAHFIPDYKLTALNFKDFNSQPKYARAPPVSVSGWISRSGRYSLYSGPWIQADFDIAVVVKNITIYSHATDTHFVQRYTLQKKQNGQFVTHKTFLIGVGGMGQNFTTSLKDPALSTSFRIVPTLWNGKSSSSFFSQPGPSLRFEFLGCIEQECKAEPLVSGDANSPNSDGHWLNDTTDIKVSNNDQNHLSANRKSDVRFRDPNRPDDQQPSGWGLATPRDTDYIQFHLGKKMRICGIVTMGGYVGGDKTKKSWISSYAISYGSNESQLTTPPIQYYKDSFGDSNPKIFQANSDGTSPKENPFSSPLEASYIRMTKIKAGTDLPPVTRVEIKGCIDGCEPVALIDGEGDNKVGNSQLTAINSHNYYKPYKSRMSESYCWNSANDKLNDWLQVDFRVAMKIKAVATKGCAVYGRQSYLKRYTLASANPIAGDCSDSSVSWAVHTNPNTGEPINYEANINWKTIRKQFLIYPIVARCLRIYALEFTSNSVYRPYLGVKWEVYGCPGPHAVHYVGCYNNQMTQSGKYVYYGAISPEICANHCFDHGYRYAGIRRGLLCSCGNSLGDSGPSPDGSCSRNCTAAPEFSCGSTGYSSLLQSVYSTGLKPESLRCAEGYKEFRDDCYKALPRTSSGYSWDTAKTQCAADRADLATINDAVTNDFVSSSLSIAHFYSAYIGLRREKPDEAFDWDSPTAASVNYTNWLVNTPSQPPSQRACTYIRNRRWADMSCTSVGSYYFTGICQKAKELLTGVTTPATSPGCEPHWVAMNYKCILIFTSVTTTATTALTECSQRGGTLLTIRNREDKEQLTPVIIGKTGKTFWINVQRMDVGTDGTAMFVYRSNNTIEAQYTYWKSSQPNLSPYYKYVYIDNQGQWATSDFRNKRHYICEKTRVGYTTPLPPTRPLNQRECTDQFPGGKWKGKKESLYCYKLTEVSRSKRLHWTEARDNCKAQGGDLASFETLDEANDCFLYTLKINPGDLSRPYRYNAWIGLSKRGNTGYSWSDNRAVAFTHWISNTDVNNWQDKDACVEMDRTSGGWKNADCSGERNWICQIKKDQNVIVPSTTPAPTAIPGGCGDIADTPSQVTRPRGITLGEVKDWLKYEFKSPSLGGISSTKMKCYGFARVGSSYYGKSWYDAEAVCKSMHPKATLVSIVSQDEQNFIQGQVQSVFQGTSSVWTGLNSLVVGRGWRWSDGLPMDYNNFDVNQPDDDFGGEYCGNMLSRNGKWRDSHCESKLSFICQIWKVKSSNLATEAPVGTTPRPSSKFCQYGWYKINEVCLQVNGVTSRATPSNFTSARAACQAQGADLASITTQPTQDMINSLLPGLNYPEMWIGLQRAFHVSRTPVWVDNKQFTYANWAPGHPTYYYGQSCGKITHTGKWVMDYCTSALPYLCSKSPSESQKPTTTALPTTSPCNLNPPIPASKSFAVWNGNCYIFVNQLSTRQDAANFCHNNYRVSESKTAGLVTIFSGYEQSFLSSWISGGGDKPGIDGIWTGLKDQNALGAYTYQWSKGPVVYTNWAANEPAQKMEGACVRMVQDEYTWKEYDCSKKISFICKIDNEPHKTVDPGIGDCPRQVPGIVWEKISRAGSRSNCYGFTSSTSASYYSAERLCASTPDGYKTTLQSIHSDTENKELQEKGKLRHQNQLWLGLTRSYTTAQGGGTYKWADGTALQFTNWAGGKPPAFSAFYRWVYMNTADGKWYRGGYRDRATAVCKMPLPKDQTTQPLPTGTEPGGSTKSTTPGTGTTPSTTLSTTTKKYVPPPENSLYTAKKSFDFNFTGFEVATGVIGGLAAVFVVLLLLYICRYKPWTKPVPTGREIGGFDGIYRAGQDEIQVTASIQNEGGPSLNLEGPLFQQPAANNNKGDVAGPSSPGGFANPNYEDPRL